jgi:hypothetical protein
MFSLTVPTWISVVSSSTQEALKRAKILTDEPKPAFEQPALLTGAKLKDYQLEGVVWTINLWENGISGILGECAYSRWSALSWSVGTAP